MELAVVGNISKDTLWYGTQKKGPTFGGAGLNIALAIAHAGKRPTLISVLGARDESLLREIGALIETGMACVLPGETCRFEIWYSEQGNLERLTSTFGVSLFFDTYLQQLELPPAHYHVCCRHPLDPDPLLARLVRQNSSSFSLDFIASSAREQIARCGPWLEQATYVFVNEQELHILETLSDLRTIPMLLVTNGSDPVIVFRHGEEVARQQCVQREFYDVTGAGDIFAGTFLVNHLIEKKPLEEAVSASIVAAQHSLDTLGIWQSPP
jgi:sugar/nucleoside kinase (ribokinase family)